VIDTVAALKEVPLFSGLSRLELAKLLPELEEHRYEPGEVLFQRGDDGDALFVVKSGRIEVHTVGADGEETVRLAVLGPGDSIGEFALLTGEPRNATARALEPVEVWRLAKDRFDYLVANNPQVALYLTRLLVYRLTATNESLAQARDQLAHQAAEQFARLPLAAQKFALKTCVLDRIRPSVLSTLPTLEDTEQCVECLEREGLLQRVSATGAWRYPDYFRDYLATRLEQHEGTTTLQRLRIQLAAYHERMGDLAAAFEMYLLSGADEAAGRMLLRHARRFMADDPRQFALWTLRLLDRDWPAPVLLLKLAAHAAAQSDDTDAAIRLYQRVLEAPEVQDDPQQSAQVLQQLAEIYLRRGDAAQAMSYMRLSGEAQGSSESGGAEQVQASMVGQLLRRGQGQAALEWARRALLTRRDVHEHSFLTQLVGANRTRWLGLVLAVAVTGGVLLTPPVAPFEARAWHVLALLLGAAVLWLFNAIPDFAVGLGLVVLCIVVGAATGSTAMSGFASQTYFVVLGVLALGAAMLRTGITYRLSLYLLRWFPPYYTWQIMGLAVAGLVLTPVIPLAMGRLAIAAPLALTISDALRLGDRSKGSAGLAMAVFLGFSTMYFPFFNGPAALLILGLFPPEYQRSVDFGSWFVWSIPLTIVLFVGSLIGILLLYPARAAGKVSPETIKGQLALLGPVTLQERLMIGVVAVALVWFVLEPFGVSPAWIMLLLLGVMIATNVLDRNGLRNSIDWPQLIYTGSMIGFAAVAAESGLNGAIGQVLVPLLEPLADNRYVFVAALVLVNFALRFVLPASPVFIIMLLSFLPLAARLDMHPFVIAQVVNVAINLWVFPQQSVVYLNLFSATEERAFTHEQARPYALLHPLLTLVGILASIPFWQAIELIR